MDPLCLVRVQDNITWALSPEVATSILAHHRETARLLELEAKITPMPTLRVASPILYTLWRTRQRVRTPTQLSISMSIMVHHHCPPKAKTSSSSLLQPRSASACKHFSSGIGRTKYRKSWSASSRTVSKRSSRCISAGKTRQIWSGTMNSWRSDWHSTSRSSTKSCKRRWSRRNKNRWERLRRRELRGWIRRNRDDISMSTGSWSDVQTHSCRVAK